MGVVFAASLAYALVRYVVVGTVPPAQIPLYVVNKAVAVTALVMLGLACVLRAPWRAWAGKSALMAAVLHMLMSMPLIGPVYFPRLHEASGRLNALGQGAFALGAVGLVLLAWRGRRTEASARARWIHAAALMLLVGLHCVALGWTGWLHPEEWPGRLPPITLLSAVYAAVVVGLMRRDAS